MSAGPWIFFDAFREYMADGTIDLDTDTFNITLHASTQALTAAGQSVYANLTAELSTANGYTSGGQALSSITWTRSGGTVTFDSADAVWTASGGSIVARYAVIRKVGTANSITDPLVVFCLLDSTPADVTVTDGNSLTIQIANIFSLA